METSAAETGLSGLELLRLLSKLKLCSKWGDSWGAENDGEDWNPRNMAFNIWVMY